MYIYSYDRDIFYNTIKKDRQMSVERVKTKAKQTTDRRSRTLWGDTKAAARSDYETVHC